VLGQALSRRQLNIIDDISELFGRIVGEATRLVTSIEFATGDVKRIKGIENFDIGKYAGQWYEVARLENTFQDSRKEGATAKYTKKCKEDDDNTN
jgi:lipocalin